jgi:ATP/maltotriose-dependent transcriptional regulator MalT
MQLCLVTAPAGYGKSTFLAQCERQFRDQGVTSAWLTLEEDDNAGDQFFYYLGAAFGQLNPAIDSELVERHLGQRNAFSSRRLLSELLNQLDAAQQYALFFDDYHVIDNPQIHEALQYLLKHLPDNLCLLIGSRSLPPIPLARLRAANKLVLLDSSDLGFDETETRALLHDVNRLEVSTEEVSLLCQRTGGWAAVLQLAALSMRGAADRAKFVQAFSGDHESVSDFLAEEVVASMPESLAGFLMRIAILDRFCAPLCLAVSGDREHSSGLAQLRDSRFLVQSLGEGGYWYRLHPLFRNFLLRQLESDNAQQLPELHQRASAWFEEEGLMAEAIQHAISAGDENRALELLDDHGVSLLTQGYMFQFFNLVRRLPEELLLKSQGVLIQLAWLQVLSNQLPKARLLLDELKARFSALDRAQQVEVYGIEATLNAIDDQLDKVAQLVNTWLPQAPPEPVHIRPGFQVLQALVHVNRMEFASALEVSQAVLSEPAVSDLVYSQSYAACISTLVHLAGARLREGASHIQKQLENIQRHVMPSSQSVALMESLMGTLHYYRGNIPQAEVLFQQGLEAQRVIASVDLVVAVLRARARLLHGLRRYDQAFDYLNEAQAQAEERGWVRLQACVMHERVRLYLALGELPRARACFAEWLQYRKLLPRAPATSMSNIDEWTRMAEVRLILAGGDAVKAAVLLKALIEESTGNGLVLRAMELLVLLARAYLSANKPEQAKRALADALSLDPENGVIQLFRDEGKEVIAALMSLKQDLKLSAEPERHELWQQQIDTIVTPYQLTPEVAGDRQKVDLSSSGLVGTLTKKELATLALLVEGLSNREISDRLCVSTNTVKTHLKSAYGKLGVSRRTQAVRCLKRLGIFE